ncbi:MAG: cupredoxin domain-containing protein [Chloroflexi bacterium]|nr:cupredoxin domain-containing protein [Chloroflexota bacterium]
MEAFAALALALGASAGGAALFLLHDRHGRVRASRRPDGTQEARVVVQHGYRPAHIELALGVPAILRFERREDDPCSELLVSELLPSSYRLAPHAETVVRFTPMACGTFAFTCGLGLYNGLLIVGAGRDRQRRSSPGQGWAQSSVRTLMVDDDDR